MRMGEEDTTIPDQNRRERRMETAAVIFFHICVIIISIVMHFWQFVNLIRIRVCVINDACFSLSYPVLYQFLDLFLQVENANILVNLPLPVDDRVASEVLKPENPVGIEGFAP